MIIDEPRRSGGSSRLPADLVGALQRARRLEHLAVGLDQQRRAIAATSALMLAAVDTGWQCASIGRVIGLQPGTARRRVRAARGRYRGQRPALVLDEPLRRPAPAAVLAVPVSDREWLSIAEAVSHTDRSPETIKQWRRYGLLPNTHRISPTRMLYLRADVDRVLAAPQYRPGQVDRASLLADQGRAGVAVLI